MLTIVTTDYENLFATVWKFGHDWIAWTISLVFVLVLGIMFYEWFRFRP